MRDWNVVVTVRDNRFRKALEVLAPLGRTEVTEFYNVLVMKVEDPRKGLEALRRRMESDASVAEAVAHLTAIDDAFEATPWGGVGFPADLLRADGGIVPCELSVLTTRRSGLPWYVITVRRVGYERALDLAVEAMAEGASIAPGRSSGIRPCPRRPPPSTSMPGIVV